MRDATFTLWGLYALGLDWEANDFLEFIADLPRNKDGTLQIMYGIGGERNLREDDAPPSEGLRGRAPVRKGNGAYDQARTTSRGRPGLRLPARQAPRRTSRIACGRCSRSRSRGASEVWREPDRGSGRRAGEPQHYVSSKVMCWVALDRGAPRRAARRSRSSPARGGQRRGDPRRHPRARRGFPWRVRPALRHRALDASLPADPDLSVPAGDDARVRARCSPSPTSSPSTAWSCATASMRPTTASAARRAPS